MRIATNEVAKNCIGRNKQIPTDKGDFSNSITAGSGTNPNAESAIFYSIDAAMPRQTVDTSWEMPDIPHIHEQSIPLSVSL